MKTIDISQLLTYQQYADKYTSDKQPLSRQRVYQLVNDGRLTCIMVGDKRFISKKEKIKPSQSVIGRPK